MKNNMFFRGGNCQRNQRRTFISVLAVIFLGIFSTSGLAQVGYSEGNLGAHLSLRLETIGVNYPSAATLAFGPSMNDSYVTVSNVSVNGGSITAPIAPGETVNIHLNYSIAVDPACPSCIQQIVFGFASESEPGFCIDTGVGSASGSSSFTLTAPATPGTHYLAFGRQWQFSCAGVNSWPVPGLKSYIGAVAVEAAVDQTAATLAFGPSMNDSYVTVSNVSVNGGSITAPIAPGETVNIHLNYSIAVDPACPSCIQQIVFGFASESEPGFCIDTGVGSASGSSSFTLTAPATPGTHYPRFRATVAI